MRLRIFLHSGPAKVRWIMRTPAFVKLMGCASAIVVLAGCTQTTTRPRTALRSPGSYNSATALLFRAPAPKPDIVVGLPNTPGGKVHVTTVADGLFGKPSSTPVTPPSLPVQTGITVVTGPAATQPATTHPASTQPAATQPASTRPATTQPANATAPAEN